MLLFCPSMNFSFIRACLMVYCFVIYFQPFSVRSSSLFYRLNDLPGKSNLLLGDNRHSCIESPISTPSAMAESIPSEGDDMDNHFAHNLGIKLVIGTRLHLGNASRPPSDELLIATLTSFVDLVHTSSCFASVIAVDGDNTKIPGYNLKSSIERLLPVIITQRASASSPNVKVIAVTPWGQFVPALNAIVSWASTQRATHLLFVSAETKLTNHDIDTLMHHCSLKDTLVSGALLPGHDYRPSGKDSPSVVGLTGRTTPWNTAAIWNVQRLALTGFPLVADGIHENQNGAVPAGVEEVSTIALHQSIWPEQSKAKLIRLAKVEWNQKWDDEGRRKWHEAKMKSKEERPALHLDIMFGSRMACNATVLHF